MVVITSRETMRMGTMMGPPLRKILSEFIDRDVGVMKNLFADVEA
jgi:hypothetical protein